MKMTSDMPFVDPWTGRTPISAAVPRPNGAADPRPRHYVTTSAAAPRACCLCALPHAHAGSIDRRNGAQRSARRDASRHRRRAREAYHAVGWRADPFNGIKSAPQHAIAVDRARWQGEPCAPSSHKPAPRPKMRWRWSRSYEVLPAVADTETALDPATPVIHAELGDNLSFELRLEAGERQGFRRSRRGGRGNLPFRPQYRRYLSRARRRRLLRGRARLTVYMSSRRRT